MQPTTVIWTALLVLVFASPASASPTCRCKGERIERGNSTWGYARKSGTDFRIEKGSCSIGWVKKRGSKWSIETFAGSTLGRLSGDRIERPNGSTWARMSDARRLVDGGPDPVAAALWILNEGGKLR